MMDILKITLAMFLMIFLLFPIYLIGIFLNLLVFPVQFAAIQVQNTCEYLLKEDGNEE